MKGSIFWSDNEANGSTTSSSSALVEAAIATTETPLTQEYEEGHKYWNSGLTIYDIFVDPHILLFHNICVPIVGTIGLICNVLSVILMTRKAIRRTSTSVYLTALAVTDTACVTCLFVYFFIWPAAHVGYRAGKLPLIVCKLQVAFEGSFLLPELWLLVCVSAERCLAIWFPLRAKTICTRRNAKIAVAVLFTALPSWYLFSVFEDGNISGYCVSRNTFLPAEHFVLVSSFLYCFIPVPLLFVINGALVVKLGWAQLEREQMVTKSDSKGLVRITITVCIVCVCSLVFTIPKAVLYVWFHVSPETFKTKLNTTLTLELISNVLAMCNYSVNFFIYVLMSSKFRAELAKMMRWKAAGKAKSVEGSSTNQKHVSDVTGSYM